MVFNQPQSGLRTPTPYDKELSAIARRERMAQIMQQQALQPFEISSYQGIQAPISPLQPLAKALQMYAAVTAGDRSDDARAALGQRMQTEGAAQIAGLEGTPAQPAIAPTPGTSFTPTGADFEDNPNLPVAPSGNVEIAGTPGRPAIPAMPLNDVDKRQRLIQILTGGNPYAAPAAKYMLEDMQKSGTGPLAEYKLYSEQAKARGETPLSIDAYKTRQIQAGRAISTNVVNMPAGAPIAVERDGKLIYVQMGKDGKYVEVQGISPPSEQTQLSRELADAGITRDNPQFQALANAYLNKKLTQVISPNATVVLPTGERSQSTPAPSEGSVNVVIDGVTTAMPIAQADALNARFKGAETSAVEQARAGFEFVTVPDPQNPAQKILVPKSRVAAQAAGGNPVVAEIDKKVAQGVSVLELAEKAKGLLPQASSGALSTLATLATDAAGIATDKSKADGALNVISAGLTSNVPRFEGPQGVLDVQLYKQAAADVGNSLIPYKKRLAALNTVIELNQKYAPVSAPPPNSVRRIK
jgi:hypothetical protein